MQVANVKKVTKPELISEAFIPALSQKADEVNLQKSNVVDLQKQKSFTRFLEAYGDCV